MKILSLFDGMACGAVAFTEMGLQIDRYVAYEIDKYAVKVASHNFPYIEQRGDVFQADFNEFNDFDWLIGGSPCTYWSIAQKNNRETEASGLGWELFSQYVRALHDAKPKYFLYENNKSMSKEIKASITEAFGFEPVLINSALVSAQNRQRLYWVGIRQEDGTYRKADVEQPDDKGILLRDVLDSAYPYRQTETEKGYCLDANYWKTPGSPETFLIGGHTRANRTMAAEPVNTCGEKSHTLKAQYYKNGIANFVCNDGFDATAIAEPVCVAQRGRYAESGEIIQHYEPREDGKTNAITTVQKDNAIAEPVCMRYERTEEAKIVRKQYEAGEIKHGFHELHELHPRDDGKTNTLSTVLKDNPICEPVRIGCYPSPDGKTYPVYEVLNGLITIKDKQYPIKLADGFYIIRKLTVSECMRLQTVPEWYDFSIISNSQAYKCLGNGWTVDVITHLIQSAQIENAPTESQLR